MIWFKFCLILFSTHLVLSSDDDYCVSQTPCKCVQKSSCIDLSFAGTPEYPRFIDVFFENDCNSTATYSYSPCFPFDSIDRQITVDPAHKPCKDAAACVKGPGGAAGEFPEEHAIGIQATASFGHNKAYPFIQYTVPSSDITLTVILTCDNDTSHKLSMVKSECKDNKDIVMNFTSKFACPVECSSPPPPASSGLSVGSKLLIAFFTILLAYIVVGVVWNLCNGSQGVELIPNIGFWNELPTLIMEGVLFTCSCFSRNNSYGEV